MSIGSSHLVSKLEKNSKAIDGQRLARVIAKKGKDGNYENENLNESKAISIPQLSELKPTELQSLMPHILGMVMNAQDEIIRECIINGASSIHDDQISIAECIKYLDDSAKGGRITSEFMQNWFVETYGDPAMEFVCNAVCKFDADALTPDQVIAIDKRVNVLRDMFAGWASPKYSPDIPKCKAMRKFGEYLGSDNWDARMSAIQEKAKNVQEKKEMELSMDALGFAD